MMNSPHDTPASRPPRRKSGWMSTALTILLAVVFVVSAVAKLFGIDQFELYVYSFGFFPLNLCFILVRLCIGIELALGVLLLVGWHRRWILTAILAMLLFFSLFLCYTALHGRTDSCQCFGQLADMPPALSLLKNAVLIVITLLAIKLQCKQRHRPEWLAVVLTLAAMATPFIVSVPDSWMFGASHERYNKDALREFRIRSSELGVIATAPGQLQTPNSELRTLIAFVTPGCPYCRMTHQKLDAMAERNGLPDGSIIFIEPQDIGDSLFLAITYGARPLLLLMQGDSVTATYHYRNINEQQIVKTLKNNMK